MEHLTSEAGDETLVITNSYQAVLPHYDGTHERAHAQDIVSLGIHRTE